VSTSISQRKRDDHGNDRQSRCINRLHHSPRQSTRITHAISGLGRSPSVSPIRSKRIILEVDSGKLSHQLSMVKIEKEKR
jgi:hypothetical protein